MKQLHKIAVFGSLTLDLFVKPSESHVITQTSETFSHSFFALPHGGKVSADHIAEHCGGGASNIGVSFSRLGNTVTCFGGIGDDEVGEKILKNLASENISSDGVEKFSDTKSGFSLILNAFDGERTVIFTSEANKKFSGALTSLMDQDFDALYLCHISGTNAETLFSQIENVLKENPEKKFFWNPGKERIEKGIEGNKDLLKCCDVLFVNKEEAEKFSGVLGKPRQTPGEDFRKKHSLLENFSDEKIPDFVVDMSATAEKFLESGVKNVVITDGRRGAQIFSQEEYQFIPCFPGERIDTLGAGDSFASTFSSFYLQGKPLKKCGKYASINAASVVEKQGAQDGLLTNTQLSLY